MGGIYQSLFDNPRRYNWEPDAQKEREVIVVKVKSEDWPDKGDIITENAAKDERQKELYYRKQDLKKLVKRRDQLKKEIEKKTKKLSKLQEVTIEVTSLRKEVAKYEKDVVKLNSEIFKLERYTITAGHLKELLLEVEDDCVIQVNSSDNEFGGWKNCRYNMIRVMINELVARRMVPQDEEDKKKLGYNDEE